MTDQVRAVCYPPDDEAFVARVDELLTEPGEAGEALRATVQALLRQTYPSAVVSARATWAALDGRPTFYVYRDGSITPTSRGDPREDDE